MPDQALPAIFVSHGAPDLVENACAAQAFMAGLAERLPRPRSVLAVSAHWESAAPAVGTAEKPATVHDFSGFPPSLYRIRYPAPGAPGLAARAADLIRRAGMACTTDDGRGLDHGAWAPLMLIYPQANVPVCQLSIQPALGPGHHLDLGLALAPLREDGVLILASGGAVHNLAHYEPGGTNVAGWARRFDDWLAETVVAGRADDLVRYRDLSPDGAIAHPRDEHLLPLMVAMGAGGEGSRATALYRGFMDGALSMAAYAFA